jgi:phage-related baseplate assembly protein
MNRFQGICGTSRKHLKKTRTDTQMKFYKVAARPSLLYGSETWVTMKRDMTRLEAAEMRFVRSAAGYTRLDKIRSEAIRKELEISGIQDVRLKYKQTWINNFERMDNTTVAYLGSLFGGGGSTNSVEDRGQRERGSGGR